MKKRKLIPDYIKKSIQPNSTEGSFYASVLLIDVVGFTALTDNLVKQDIEGAEILYSILNRFFTNSLKKIYNNQGFISSFEGDGFVALFPALDKNSILRTIKAAIDIQHFFKQNGKVKTKFGKYDIQVKINITYGLIIWKIIQNYNVYYAFSKAIDRARQQNSNCLANQIILDKYLKNKLKDNFINYTARENYFIFKKLNNKSIFQNLESSKLTSITYSNQYEFLNIDYEGEFKDIITCFLQIKESKFHCLFPEILTTIKQFKGFFKDINIYNKKNKILIFFGAPHTIEKVFSAAIGFAIAIKQRYNRYIKTSLTFGNAFVGLLENEFRNEFVAFGDIINLAARILEQTNWGEILIDHSLWTKIKDDYEISCLDNFLFKGFHNKKKIYKLIKEKKYNLKKLANFVGRKNELKKLKQYIIPLYRGQFSGICYIEGVAGIGKTCLIEKLEYETEQDFIWFNLKCNQIIQSSFNPVKNCLNIFFKQSTENEPGKNKNNFEKIFAKFSQKVASKKLGRKIIELKPALAKYLNLDIGAEFNNYNARIKHRKMLEALDYFFLSFTDIKPVVINIDDGHLIDSDTKKWFKRFTTKAVNYPIAVLITVRPPKNSRPFSYYRKPQEFEHFLKLTKFDNKSTSQLISTHLEKENVNTNLEKFIKKKSEGNPFYIQQITLFLKEHNLINTIQKGEVESLEVPADIRLIISARIEKLDSNLKRVLKIAAVIGEKFNRIMLAQFIGKKIISPNLMKGIRKNIWISLSKTEYIFKHVLIRDTVYQMQMKKEIRQLHEKIANAYIKVYQKEHQYHYATIAFHYDKAENIEQAIVFYQKAAKQAMKSYFNASALKYLDKLLEFKDNLTTKEYVQTIFDKSKLYKTIGKWKKAEEITKIALKIAENNELLSLQAYILSIFGWLEYMKGNFKQAIIKLDKASAIFKQNKDEKGLSIARGNKAVIFMRSNQFKKAEKFFKEKIEWDEKNNFKLGLMSGYINYAVFLNKTGKVELSKDNYYKGLKLAQELNDKLAISTAYANLALIYMSQDKMKKAKELFGKTLKISLQIGEKRKLTYTYGNIGHFYIKEMNWQKAHYFFNKQIELSKELKYIHGIIASYINKKSLEANRGNLIKAKAYLDKALTIANQNNAVQELLRLKLRLGLLYFDFRKFDKSLFYFNKLIKYAASKSNYYFLCLANYNIGIVYKKKEILPKSLEFFQKAEKLSRQYSLRLEFYKIINQIISILIFMDKPAQAKTYLAEKDVIKKAPHKTSIFLKINQSIIEFKLERNREIRRELLNKIDDKLKIIDGGEDYFEYKYKLIKLYETEYDNKNIVDVKKQKLKEEIEKKLKKDLRFTLKLKIESIKKKLL